MVLITALFIKSRNGTLRKAFIAFFVALAWSILSRFMASAGLLEIDLGLSLIPLTGASSFLMYYVYISPYNEAK